MEWVNTNEIGNLTSFEKLKEEYGGNRTHTYILHISYHHAIINMKSYILSYFRNVELRFLQS